MASKSEEKDARVKGMVEQMKPPKGKFKSMTIDAADNGYSVRTHREAPADDSKSNGAADNGGTVAPTMDAQDKGHSHDVFSDENAVVKHVAHHLGK